MTVCLFDVIVWIFLMMIILVSTLPFLPLLFLATELQCSNTCLLRQPVCRPESKLYIYINDDDDDDGTSSSSSSSCCCCTSTPSSRQSMNTTKHLNEP